MPRATSYEILNTGAPSVFALHESVLKGAASRRLIGQTLNFYDVSAFQGLPFGQWRLTFANTVEVRNLFDSEVIEDILFLIATSGRTPAWPV